MKYPTEFFIDKFAIDKVKQAVSSYGFFRVIFVLTSQEFDS